MDQHGRQIVLLSVRRDLLEQAIQYRGGLFIGANKKLLKPLSAKVLTGGIVSLSDSVSVQKQSIANVEGNRNIRVCCVRKRTNEQAVFGEKHYFACFASNQ